jgi:hypothetical protein
VRAAMGRAGGRCASGHAGGSSGARGRPRGVRAVPREGARRAGRETGCPGNGGKPLSAWETLSSARYFFP